MEKKYPHSLFIKQVFFHFHFLKQLCLTQHILKFQHGYGIIESVLKKDYIHVVAMRQTLDLVLSFYITAIQDLIVFVVRSF